MQTILGSTGQIGRELAKALRQQHTSSIRLVSRTPEKIHPDDELFPADLMDAAQANAAIAGSSIVYFTVGLPNEAKVWQSRFPIILQNVISACEEHAARLVFFDNTYMYPKDDQLQTEEIAFVANGAKGQVRAQMATMVLSAIKTDKMKAVICRAPEFYGPGKTQSITNATVFDKLLAQEKATVFVSDQTRRTLIWTPDASRAMALIGNTPDAFGQTWHLPCDDDRLTYQQLLALIEEVSGKPAPYSILKAWMIRLAGIFNPQIREVMEQLPRYAVDNLFDSTKFKQHFPDFRVTTYREGVQAIMEQETT